MVNRGDQCCIVLYHGYFVGTELYAVKQWVKIVAEGQDTAYLPINNSSI